MRFRASEIAAATDGSVSGPDVEVEGATIDSREARAGTLFVPIVGERDGHDFITAAAGSPAYLTARGIVDPERTAIEVPDTGAALLALGGAARARLPDRVVGITGSVGKTTVKDMTRAVLATTYRTTANERSFNNELGVPLTLLNAPDDTEATVLEMGARGRGHIAMLCATGRPTVGVVTTVEMAHTEMFGSVEEVAIAKAELVEALPASGTAILNADNPLVVSMASRTDARVLSFSTMSVDADVTASDVTIDDELRARFRLDSPFGAAEVHLSMRGAHQVGNALAAAGAGLALGVSVDAVAQGLARAVASAWRMDLRRSPTGAYVLNDAYNANPASMRAALEALAKIDARRRVAVLGVMAELGGTSDAEHRKVADLARSLGIEVVAVDAPAYDATSVDGVDGALDALGTVGDGDAILVKGSRVAGLERVAAVLLGE